MTRGSIEGGFYSVYLLGIVETHQGVN